jgi:hypothetical protein
MARAKHLPSINRQITSMCAGSQLDPIKHEQALLDDSRLDRRFATNARRQKRGLDKLAQIVKQIQRVTKGHAASPTEELERLERWERGNYDEAKRRSASKEAQWGPETTKQVKTIVRHATEAFIKRQDGLDASYWNRRVTLQEARWYAGLLCVKLGLLPTSNWADRKMLSEVVRTRVTRSKTPTPQKRR